MLDQLTTLKIIKNMSANFVSQKIFIEGFAVILEVKPVLILNKPICVGFSILDLSKLLMCEFH